MVNALEVLVNQHADALELLEALLAQVPDEALDQLVELERDRRAWKRKRDQLRGRLGGAA